MPLKLNVGLSKKIGLPDYGSLGASCHVEVELESTLLFQDLAGFHDRVRQAFAACQQALHDELQRQQPRGDTPASEPVLVAGRTEAASRTSSEGESVATPAGRTGLRRATDSQVRALVTIAERRQFALGPWLQTRHGVDDPHALSLRQASRCLDELNGAAGRKAVPV